MPDKKRTSEDVCRELIHATNVEMAGSNCEYVPEYMLHEDYEKVLERAAWYLDNEVCGMDTEDAMLLLGHDSDTLLGWALELNTEEEVMVKADLSIMSVISNIAPHELDHNQMREIINFAEELKTYLPRRG